MKRWVFVAALLAPLAVATRTTNAQLQLPALPDAQPARINFNVIEATIPEMQAAMAA